MVKKQRGDSVEDIINKEISVVEAKDKLVKLEKEITRDKKIISEYKEREKVSARALVLYERKIKYLKEILIDDILKLCKVIDKNKEDFRNLCDTLPSVNRGDFCNFNDNLMLYTDSLYDICNKMEANSVITKKDRAFISNTILVEETEPVDSKTRFDRLKQEFAQKIGSSVNRKRGRPKKSEQSIVADIGLSKKVELIVDDQSDTQNKLDDIFYKTPTTSGVVSTIPQTDDSLFDFNEALNPNISLKDIMADLMSEKGDEEIKTYGENSKIKEIEEAQREQKIELLESGFIRNPIIKTKPTKNVTIDTVMKKPTFEKKFLSIQDIIKETK